jgi:intracellular sulfur oxidation DsrE/DsrF family protein
MTTNDVLTGTDRRSFLNYLAAGAATLGISTLVNPSAFAETIRESGADDPETWVNKIKGKHKAVFDVTQPHGIYPFAWPRVFLMSNKSTGASEQDCCAVVVLRHSAIAYAFKDEVWDKYNFGEVFEVKNPGTGEPLRKNPFYKPAAGTYVVPGVGEIAIGIDQLQENGVLFSVCNAAMTVFSTVVGKDRNLNPEEVKKDWMNALIPGIQPVPSGVWAVCRAQDKGCAYVFAS